MEQGRDIILNGEILRDEVIIVSTVVIVLINIFVVVLFSVFQGRKNKLLEQQKEAKKKFESEIAETQIEIREETLRNISWELHDNIGQSLTLAKIQLQNSSGENIEEVSEIITKSLNELRALSKLINPEFIKNIQLKDAIQLEIDRFNRLNFIEASLKVCGNERKINEKTSIIIFRVLQEFFSNTIKHSKATALKVELNYKEDELEIIAKDNGIGFNKEETKEAGLGLKNIENRANLIGAKVKLKSVPNEGTQLSINYYHKE
ncbi:ATP-binding protein [Pseudotenacibaculum sp. MALMAid0570]|uniref:sensor histidine kinase n=1 Tax=Pseudotenacibaculum sp. MALMAid0570 TaxID=3143938 RepID=UPI0032DF6609